MQKLFHIQMYVEPSITSFLQGDIEVRVRAAVAEELKTMQVICSLFI